MAREATTNELIRFTNVVADLRPDAVLCPVQVEVDTSSPLGWGMSPEEAIYFADSPAFKTTFEHRGRYSLVVDRVLVIGYGNPLRGDDGVGPAVVRRLQLAAGDTAMEAMQLLPEHIEAVARAGLVVLVDAGVDLSPGEVRCRLVEAPVASRHAVDLHELSPERADQGGSRSLRALPRLLVGHRRGGRSGLRRGPVAGGRGGGRPGARGRGGRARQSLTLLSEASLRNPAPDGRSRLPRHPRAAPPTASGRPRGSSTTGTGRRPGSPPRCD